MLHWGDDVFDDDIGGFFSHGVTREHFVGYGAVLGLLPALVGRDFKGMGPAYAAKNALGRGPIILTLPASTMQYIRQRAAGGDPEYQQLELDMFRSAALYVVELLEQDIVEAATEVFMETEVCFPLEESFVAI